MSRSSGLPWWAVSGVVKTFSLHASISKLDASDIVFCECIISMMLCVGDVETVVVRRQPPIFTPTR
jgi:hypothetical protein